MQTRTVLAGLLAIIFSASATFTVFLFIRRSSAPAEIETVAIVVAAEPVARGVTLSADMLQMRSWPASFVPADSLTDIDEAVGRTVWVPLMEDEAVVEPKLAAKGAGRGMAALIPSGMRAITIQTPNVSTGMAGFILPGNRVDLLWTRSQVGRDDRTGGGSTVTILQNIEILAVDQQIELPNENRVNARELRSVTLMVAPTEAAKIDLAQNRGTLRLSLRNPEDLLTDAVEAATLTSMLQLTMPDLDELAGSLIEPLGDPEAVELEPLTAASVPAPGAAATDNQLPIRTLRGTSSGAAYLRTPAAGYPSG